jgi:hypothetical protein
MGGGKFGEAPVRLGRVVCDRVRLDITGEWQAFVGRRVQEDLRLWEELAGAKAPAELWSAYTKFWQTAVEDYRHEYLTLSNLYAEAATSGTTAQQQASEAALLYPKAA